MKFLNVHEKRTWKSLTAVINGCLGNNSADNYKKLVETKLTILKLWAAECPINLICYIFAWKNSKILWVLLSTQKNKKNVYNRK